ncbi:MAG TPA: iron-sulfur cluster assembly protein [Acidimicrobiales bacterium]
MTSNNQTHDADPTVPVGAAVRVNNVVGAVWGALGTVHDPELYLDIVSLGLVYDVREEDGTVVVEMTLTTPGCPASETISEMTRAAVVDVVDSSTPVDVRIVWDPPWSPAMIDAEAAAAAGFRVR